MKQQHRLTAVAAAVLLLTAATQAGFPVTIENCGRTDTFDTPPSRVLASTIHLNLLVELGVTDRVIGRTHLSGDPAAIPPQWVDAYQQVPEVAPTSRVPVKEELLALQPDFVLPSYYPDFDSTNGFATREELAAVGIHSYIVGNLCDPESNKDYTLEALYTGVEDLGKIFGVPDRAAQVLADLKARVADVQKRVSGRPPVRVAVLDATKDAIYAPAGGIYGDLVKRAGGETIFGYGANGYTQVSVEEVAAANADAYVLILYAPATPEERAALVKEIAPNSPGVKNNRILLIDNDDLVSGIRSVYGMEKMARFFHPDAFS